MLYSPVISAIGVFFLILKDNRHVARNVNNTNPAPAVILNASETLNVHFTIPIPFKNNAVRGLMNIELAVMPAIVEIITAGIKLAAVCNISCPVVYPIAFIIP